MSKVTVPELIEECKKYYSIPNNGVGGNLHIVLDDGNIHDEDIMYCIKLSKENGDEAGVNLGNMLMSASKTQRKKAYQ